MSVSLDDSGLTDVEDVTAMAGGRVAAGHRGGGADGQLGLRGHAHRPLLRLVLVTRIHLETYVD